MTQPAWASSAYLKLDNDVFAKETEPVASPVRTRPITSNVLKLTGDSMVVSTVQNVIGGAPSSAGAYPYNVLFTSDDGLCSGVLIHPDIVLTTVSCAAAQTSDANIGGVSSQGTGATVITVDQSVEHPDFDAATLQNDLLIIKLTETTDITPVELASAVPAVAATVTAIGFGLTAEDGAASNTLQNVDINVLDFINCENLLDATVFASTQICAGNLADGRGHCDQDEGGALLSGTTLVGLFSFNEACGAVDEPSVYTSVAAYLDFIEASICDLSSVPPEDCESAAPSISSAPSVSAAPSADPTTSLTPTSLLDTAVPGSSDAPTSGSSAGSGSSGVPTTEPTSSLAPTHASKRSSKKSSNGGKGKGKKGKGGKGGKKGGKGGKKGGKSGKGGKGGSDGSEDDDDDSVEAEARQEAVPLYQLTRQQRRRRRRRRRFGN